MVTTITKQLIEPWRSTEGQTVCCVAPMLIMGLESALRIQNLKRSFPLERIRVFVHELGGMCMYTECVLCLPGEYSHACHYNLIAINQMRVINISQFLPHL
jgi:hypothetical protein